MKDRIRFYHCSIVESGKMFNNAVGSLQSSAGPVADINGARKNKNRECAVYEAVEFFDQKKMSFRPCLLH